MLSLKDRVNAHWSDVRSFGRGLRLAWVSVTSVAFGAILFYTAPQAQDLFLEVRGSLLSGTLFWTQFYFINVVRVGFAGLRVVGVESIASDSTDRRCYLGPNSYLWTIGCANGYHPC